MWGPQVSPCECRSMVPAPDTARGKLCFMQKKIWTFTKFDFLRSILLLCSTHYQSVRDFAYHVL
ncbi:hypothetical protein Hanom_Chr16g01452081 [Helianthus anomalus]